MEFEIVKDSSNPLFKRREIFLSLKYKDATPSKADLQKLVSEKLAAEINKVEVFKILPNRGASGGKAWVNVWENKNIQVYSEIKKEQKPEEKKA